jgi:hypothetical protein
MQSIRGECTFKEASEWWRVIHIIHALVKNYMSSSLDFLCTRVVVESVTHGLGVPKKYTVASVDIELGVPTL